MEVEGERESFWDSMLEFLVLTDTETEAPLVVMREAEDFCWAAFLRSSLTVEEGAGLSILGSLEMGDLLALRPLEDLPFGPMMKRRKLEDVVVLEVAEDSWIVHLFTCLLTERYRLTKGDYAGGWT